MLFQSTYYSKKLKNLLISHSISWSSVINLLARIILIFPDSIGGTNGDHPLIDENGIPYAKVMVVQTSSCYKVLPSGCYDVQSPRWPHQQLQIDVEGLLTGELFRVNIVLPPVESSLPSTIWLLIWLAIVINNVSTLVELFALVSMKDKPSLSAYSWNINNVFIEY